MATDDVLTLREVSADEWDAAMILAARAFSGEPFGETVFGSDPLPRFANAQRFYRAATPSEHDTHLGAYIDDTLIGLCISSPSGHCHVCTHIDPTAPPADAVALIDWQFEVNVQRAHADQGAHGWISRVVVDSAVQGAGVGRTLVRRALDDLRADGAQAALLECQPHREAMYAAWGFHRIRPFTDPAGPDALLMRQDLS